MINRSSTKTIAEIFAAGGATMSRSMQEVGLWKRLLADIKRSEKLARLTGGMYVDVGMGMINSPPEGY